VNAEPKTWPHTIAKRGARVTIYRGERVKGGSTYVEFRVAFFNAAGQRKFQTVNSWDRAKKVAEARLEAQDKGLAEVVTLSGPERLDYLEAKRLLPAGHSLTDATRALLRSREAGVFAPISVADLAKKFIDSRITFTKNGKPASWDYERDLRARLARFSDAFRCDIKEVSQEAIEAWGRAQNLTGRNLFNSLRIIHGMLRWAQKRKFIGVELPTDALLFAKPKPAGGVKIFRAEELRRLLLAARLEMVPYLALGAFAGLRTAEIQRLDWGDIKLDRGFIEVGADKAKTATRRLVPVLPALAAWLAPIPRNAEKVLPFECVSTQVATLALKAGVPWRQNALRHSFISYRVAIVENVPKVALEAGNSAAMIETNYKELAPPNEAAEWFAVMPPEDWPGTITLPEEDAPT
jgi:integrase